MGSTGSEGPRAGAGALTPGRWTRIRNLFEQALDVADVERPAWLAAACSDDDALAAEVRSLLAADAAGERRLVAGAADRAPGDLAGSAIAGFRLVRVLGSGGMGTVYEAEQERPQRRVALKTLAVRFTSERARARFEDEAEILARLRHPGIAQVLAAGTFHQGDVELPWFAMELVEEPRPIDQHVRANTLPPRAIVELFLRVCAAVQFAHQRGVIHRDLKPANVLVDRAGQPKVIDFGIARVAGDARNMTRPGELLGTLEYMPPERFEHGDSADTAGDVYALGVMLWELLAGTSPFPGSGLTPVAFVELVRTTDPPPPSQEVAAVPPELDWITLRAMARAPAERYPSVEALAQDLERFLHDEPVAAGPPSASYRLKKFARRHRLLLATAATVFLALTTGGVIAAFGWHRVAGAEQRLAREAATLQQVKDFQERILRGAYGNVRGNDAKLADVVAAAAADLETRSFADPLVEVGVRNSLATSLLGLGQPGEAKRHLLRARELLVAHGGDAHAGPGVSLTHNLAVCHEQLGQLDLAEQESRAALAGHLAADGPAAPDTALAQVNLASLLVKRGRFDEALALAHTALGTFERTPGDAAGNAERVATARTTVAFATAELGQAAEADRLYDELLAFVGASLHADHPAALAAANSRAVHLHRRGRFAEYRAACAQLAATRERLHGPDHPDTWLAWNNLAAGHLECGEPAAAETTFRRVLAGQAAAGMTDGYENLLTRQNLTVSVRRQGRTAEAAELARDVAATAARVLPAGHWLRGVTQKELGACLRELGRLDDAEVELLPAVELLERALGPADHRTQKVIAELVQLYEAMREPDNAAKWRQRLRN